MSNNQDLVTMLQRRALQLRIDSVRATTQAGSGHPTSCLSAADIISVLYFHLMRYDSTNPHNPNNDRFILSKGHAVPVVYAALKQWGVIDDATLLTLRDINSDLEGHPTPRCAYNEAATGSLGQGLAVGVGMALHAKTYGLLHRTYVLLGDAEMAEGSVWEAMDVAVRSALHNLIAIVDVNTLGQSGAALHGTHAELYARKAEAFGWKALVVDGHDIGALLAAFTQAQVHTAGPVMLIAKTHKGQGLACADKLGFHGKPFEQHELEKVLAQLKANANLAPEASVLQPPVPQTVQAVYEKGTPQALAPVPYKPGAKVSPRKAFGVALQALGAADQRVMALDGDVQNSTYVELFAKSYPERFVQCMIAEQAMVSVATGLTQRGAIPFAATFGAFYARAYDQLRMAAIGKVPLRLCGTHAGVAIGQDGPSQMALEDLSLFGALPDAVVLYPSDGVSTYALTQTLYQHNQGISYLRATRGDLPVLYEPTETFPIGGCKVLRKPEHAVTCVVAAGVTLHEALKAHDELAQEGIAITVIDLYSIKPFDQKTVRATIAACGNRLITVEDHYEWGGIGQMVATALSDVALQHMLLAVPEIPRSGSPEALLAWAGIDAAGIVRAVKTLIKE